MRLPEEVMFRLLHFVRVEDVLKFEKVSSTSDSDVGWLLNISVLTDQ
jgi:hypothetical protein